MRVSVACAAGMLGAALSVSAAAAQVRYVVLSGDVMGELAADAVLKETRQGGKVVSAELDVCYAITATSDRKDRFVVPLKADGAKLSGTGESAEEKQPITVNLTRKPTGKTLAYQGTIAVAGKTVNTNSTDNTDMSEEDFQDARLPEDSINTQPADFTEASPSSLALKVKRDKLIDTVQALREENVRLAFYTLVVDCPTLRTGEQILRLEVDPERAPALLAKIKNMPGVTAAGWTGGFFDMDRAVRAPAAAWRDGGKLNHDKLAATISETVAKALGAKAEASKWDDTTGTLTMSMKRPSQLVPGLNLIDNIEVTALVGPEKLGTSDKLIIWLSGPSMDTVDEAQGARLKFSGSSTATSEAEGPPIDNGATVVALAKELNGQRWDPEKGAWK